MIKVSFFDTTKLYLIKTCVYYSPPLQIGYLVIDELFAKEQRIFIRRWKVAVANRKDDIQACWFLTPNTETENSIVIPNWTITEEFELKYIT